MDERKHHYTRRNGNIGCMLGLVVSGLIGLLFQFNDPQLKLALVAGVLLGAGIGMAIGRKKDKEEAEKRDAEGR